MTDFYPIDGEITKYVNLCARAHNISRSQDNFYKISSYSSPDSGFDGFAFKNDQTKEIVISIRGSSDNSEDLYNVSKILSGHIPYEQLKDADAFYQDITSNAPDDFSISVTGFSLGGALAQLIGTKYGLETYTFNALGMNSENMLKEAGITGYQTGFINKNNLIKNFVVLNDPIGNTGYHIGETYYLPPIFPVNDSLESHRDIIETNILDSFQNYFSLPEWDFKKALSLWKYDRLNNGEIPDNSNLLKVFHNMFTQYSDNETKLAFNEALKIIKYEIPQDNIYSFSLANGSSETPTGKISMGSDKSDILITENGNDIIYGGNENDIIFANKGNDSLFGEAGDDSYLFNKGDGIDYILDNNGTNDTLKFGPEITRNNLIFSREEDNLIINFKDAAHNFSTDKISLLNQFDSGTIEFLMFDNNSIMPYYKVDDYLNNLNDLII